jgi:hypothetical protein
MGGVNVTVLRVALALPLAFEAYRLVGFVVRSEAPPLTLLIGMGVWLLPALVLAAACLLLFVAPHGRRLWYVVAVSGLWLIFLDLYSWHGIVAPSWRPSVDFAAGLYAALLALAFLLGRVPARPISVSPPSGGAGGA